MAAEWGWAWPANRRILYNRASADPDGKPWSERKALRLVGRRASGKWTGHDVPDFVADQAARLPAARGRHRRRRAIRRPTRSSCRPTARAGCSPRPGWPTGRCPPTTSRRSRRSRNLLYRPAAQPGPADHPAPASNRYQPERRRAGLGGLPVRRHHLPADRAPHRRRDEPLAALPGRAAAGVLLRGLAASWPPSAAWSTAAGRRSSPPAARSRRGCWSPSGCGRCGAGPDRCTRSGCPTTGGRTGSPPATRPTSWLDLSLDPNVHIQEVKALTCDIRPGRRPRGPALRDAASRDYRRAGRHHRRDRDGGATMSDDLTTRGPACDDPAGDAGYARPPAADGLLHRHLGVHRLQGLRGGLQGVERGPRGRARC